MRIQFRWLCESEAGGFFAWHDAFRQAVCLRRKMVEWKTRRRRGGFLVYTLNFKIHCYKSLFPWVCFLGWFMHFFIIGFGYLSVLSDSAFSWKIKVRLKQVHMSTLGDSFIARRSRVNLTCFKYVWKQQVNKLQNSGCKSWSPL